MIKLNKLPEPAILTRKKQEWTAECMAAKAAGEDMGKHNKYRNAEIKTQLEEETSKKCAYCESKMKHVTYGDIEHISPKESFPEKTYEWENLTLACDVCNTNKGTYYSTTAPLLNPYTDTPDNHIWPFGPLILHMQNDVKGETTIIKFALNRGELLERRKERVQGLVALADKYMSSTGDLKTVLEGQLRKELEQDKEYVLVVKEYLNKACNLN